MDARELRGMEIAATTTLRRSTEAWVVPSQSHPGATNQGANPHQPTLNEGLVCTCPDYELRQQPCKHVIAVEYTVRREITPDGEVLTQQMKVTYTQDWASYNAAQCAEGDLFGPMLADLCSTIPQPQVGPKGGRPRMPMSDMAFAAVSKIYAGLSARRFDSDVREAKDDGLTETDPHFNTVLKYLRDPAMTPILTRLVEISAEPLADIETDFAADSTGFSTSKFDRWYDEKWGKQRSERQWVKLHAMTGVRTNVVTAVEMTDKNGSDTLQFRPMLTTTAQTFTIRDVTADKAYSGKVNLAAVEAAGGTPYVPFKAHRKFGPVPAINDPNVLPPGSRSTTWDRMYHMFMYQRETFLHHYHQRSNVECTFSVIKRKFGDSVRSKSKVGQLNEVLCKVIAHNICVVIAAMHELGLPMPEYGQAPNMVG